MSYITRNKAAYSQGKLKRLHTSDSGSGGNEPSKAMATSTNKEQSEWRGRPQKHHFIGWRSESRPFSCPS